ncbi:MAG TPA: FtsQ-type POTRA domain-containing protein [Solirubrobacteraceae bacterium]|jgi:cell division protein FtsQ|nr:FtsQ-type POTRA domain-containing protein [Solirubrobacteraceae bacterium]
MDRSLAGRLGIGGLPRQPARARQGASAARRPKRRAPARRRQANVFDTALGRLAALIGAIWRLSGDGWSYVWRRRRLRLAAIVALVAMPLLAGGWLWLRGSSLVAVSHVRVTGVHGSDAHAIDAALSSAAHGMTTLQVNPAALRAAVASYPVVRDLKISTSFPHGMSIRVVEQPAVAALTVAGTKTAVAANGVVLGPGLASGSLPAIAGASLPSPGQLLHNAALLSAVAVLGAAPAPLAKQVTRAYSSTKGLTLFMHSGLRAYFGDGTRPHAKWLSLSRVLADPSSAGASYVDVRLPERPAAGFPGGVAPSSTTSEAEASSSGSSGGESTEAIAEKLSKAVGGGSSAVPQSATSPTSGEAEAQAEAQSPSASGGEASGAASAKPGG